jgi:hypothetical protein
MRARSVIFTVTLRTHSERAHRRLARLLKTAWRRDQLRVIDVREHAASKVSRCRTAPAVRTMQGRRGDKTMDMRKYSGAAFLKPDDVRAGPLRKVIAGIAEGKYGKPDLEFDDGTKLGVNSTRNRALINAYGGESDGWLKKEIELSLGEAEYQGEMQESIVVKPISPAIKKKPSPPKPKPKSEGGGDMNDEIPF